MIKPLSLFLFLCASVPLLSTPVAALTEQNQPEKAQLDAASIQQAQLLLTEGKLEEAIKLLAAIPKSDLNALQINHLLGVAYYQKRDYANAVEYLTLAVKQALRDSKQYQTSVQLLGMSHYFLGHIKEAIPYLEQIKEWDPDNVEMAYVLGISHIQDHNPEGARHAFARMYGVAPDSASAYLLNAQMMIRQQFEEYAAQELKKALEMDPRLPQAHFLLGEMAVYKARLDEGIELLKREIEINPGFAMAYYMLGEAYTRQLKWDEARPPLQKSIWLNPFFSGPYIVLGKVYLKKGDLSNAEAILRRALQMDPNNYSGHHLLGQVLQQSNKPDEAKKEFELADRLQNGSNM